jgi:uncharacterized Fe-S radical SAM superfamily protein PflX
MNAPAAFRPAYLALLDSGELERRVASAYRHLEDCDPCALYFRVNRRRTLGGVACRTGEKAALTEEQIARILAQAERVLSPYVTPRGTAEFPTSVHIVTGKKL